VARGRQGRLGPRRAALTTATTSASGAVSPLHTVPRTPDRQVSTHLDSHGNPGGIRIAFKFGEPLRIPALPWRNADREEAP